MDFSFVFLIAAFSGGVMGASFRGLPVFILCGAAAIIEADINAEIGDSAFSNVVAFGSLVLLLGIAFARGVVAAVYAVSKGKISRRMLKKSYLAHPYTKRPII